MSKSKRAAAETLDRLAKHVRVERHPAGNSNQPGVKHGSEFGKMPKERVSSKVSRSTSPRQARHAGVVFSKPGLQQKQQKASQLLDSLQLSEQQSKHTAPQQIRTTKQPQTYSQHPRLHAEEQEGRELPDEDEGEGEDDDEGPEERSRGASKQRKGRTGALNMAETHEDGQTSDEEDSEADKEEEEDAAEGEPCDIPFEELERLRQNGAGPTGAVARAAAAAAKKVQGSFHRENRHRPSEQSSKRPVGRYRDVIQVPNRQACDPRFPDEVTAPSAARAPLAEVARKRYAFVYDEMLPEEKRALQARIKKERLPQAKASLQAELTRINQLVDREKQRRKSAELQGQLKGQERAAVTAGKAPFYLKKSERKRLELLAKYQELAAKGQVDKFIEKRRKKNASKDHRYLPKRQQ